MNIAPALLKVWDPLVRVLHWTLVIGFFTAYFTGDEFLDQHVWSGYLVGGVVLVRILWGFVGSRYARFSEFVKPPSETMSYLRSIVSGHPARYLGHNPAGALMILALLTCVSITGASGLVLYGIEENAGPLAGLVGTTPGVATALTTTRTASSAVEDDDDEHDGESGRGEYDEGGEEFWEEIHEVSANLMLFLILFHVGGVLYSSYQHGENLVRSMFTGTKRTLL